MDVWWCVTALTLHKQREGSFPRSPGSAVQQPCWTHVCQVYVCPQPGIMFCGVWFQKNNQNTRQLHYFSSTDNDWREQLHLHNWWIHDTHINCTLSQDLCWDLRLIHSLAFKLLRGRARERVKASGYVTSTQTPFNSQHFSWPTAEPDLTGLKNLSTHGACVSLCVLF